ncbi:DUF2062 domain-containing protein [Mesoterricola silvestris]|uniref:DUF2062 domain-containing protein n=1 Tax=Mesoterricola silvestris TaxID=2927979 RepID=A0AA48GUV5_9BACT|nr:DUF2062 domain-containing protein [Mesoterricola silvestris]BDU72241.1 hypothetical protein METEAL_14150 [Mesoterricola silvestris]
MTDQPPQDAPKPGLLAALKSHILHPEMTSEQVALSFGVGFSLAWNPLLGLHTAIVLLACFLSRRLHRPIMFLACFINNPWTMVPMATASAYMGNLLLGRGLNLNLGGIRWHEITWRSFASREGLDCLFGMLKPILLPYLLGGFVLSALAMPLGYFAMLHVARRLRRVHLHLPHRHHPKP